MIEELLAAFADGADDSGPSPGIGAEEIADILWLAARVDAGREAAAPPAPATGPAGQRPPEPEPDPASPEAGSAPDPSPAPGGPAGGESAVRLFPATVREPTAIPAGPGGAATGLRGTPLRLPRAASLDDPLALMRSLRPVGRRSIGGPGEELDEQLTVERSIERMVVTPVLRPAESRWLDLALVVDTHHSMLLWADLVDELRRVFTRSGVFRDVRIWQLTGTGSGATPMVTRGRGGPPRNPLELADPAGRRLILVVSDTVAEGWREAPVQGVLRHWCAHNAVAVLNVLPERLWTRGAVRPVPFAVRADRPAAATRSWQQVPAVRRARPGRRRAAAAVVPVVGVAPGSLARLVRVVSGDGRWRRLACLRLDAEPGYVSAGSARVGFASRPGEPAPAGGARSALEAVEHFRAHASPTAQQLAAHLAAVPLTLPVMTLVRRSLLRDSEHGHLAEVALGGLFEPWRAGQDPEDVEFAFLPGVREALLGSQLRGDVAAVRELVRRRVWEFMSRNRGPGPDFSATRVTGRRDGRRRVPDGALPFAAKPQPHDLPEPGLRERVVRVRYDTLPEPQEVGTLLTPRLVLTVGDAALSRSTAAWVRAGDREVPCRPVWWDDAAPRVFLLRADEDLVERRPDRDPALWSDPLAWSTAEPGAGAVRLRVDGRTDRGEPVALTGEVVPYEGARNGELVRLSAEPESWTHYRGGPVSADGRLTGVVHGVWPDRMVFLSGRALLEQPGFRAALTDHARAHLTAAAGSASGDAVREVCLAVQPGDGGAYPIGASPEQEVVHVLTRLMGDARVAGELTGGEGGPVLVLLDAPGALAKAGRLLSELPGAWAAWGDRRAEGLQSPLGVSVATGAAEAVRLVGHPQFVEAGRRSGRSRSPLLALSRHLGGDLDALLSPGALSPLGSQAWFFDGDFARLGRALVEAAGRLDEGVSWPTCGLAVPQADPAGCTGIRLTGYDRCLAHVEGSERRAYLRTLRHLPGVDLRGTTFEDGLLGEVLGALKEQESGRVLLGGASFDHARFVDDWTGVPSTFSGRSSFQCAVFEGWAGFEAASFAGAASFDDAVFRQGAAFDRSRFHRGASFRRARFGDGTGFTRAVFVEDASFARAVFEGKADLAGIKATGPVDFTLTAFRGTVALDAAEFSAAVSFAHARWERELVAREVSFGGPVSLRHARFRAPARFEAVRLGAQAGAGTPFGDAADRWTVHGRSSGAWDITLADPGGA
ncbi:SAV_2336 N-terminal domain-related protein [Streptomyces sp. NPDC054787]